MTALTWAPRPKDHARCFSSDFAVEGCMLVPRLYEINTAWIAGLFEGEGSVSCSLRPRHSKLVGKISSTDKDVLDLLLERAGVGLIMGPYPPQGFGKKDFYVWSVQGNDAVSFLNRILPFMASRRTSQILSKLELWDSRPITPPKTTFESRKAIRSERAAGDTLKVIAERHNISLGYVGQICSGFVFGDELEAGCV